MNTRKNRPLFGVGLRSEHYSYLQDNPQTKVDFFEVITENYLDTEGRPKQILRKIRENYPLHFHGVSMNIAAHSDISTKYLDKLKNMIHDIRPVLVSDHLCWTGLPHANLHNLLPFPYNEETLEHLCRKIDFVQNYLGREMIFENLSAYFDFTNSTYTEWDFWKTLLQRSGCKMLLDINNIYVNAINQKFDPQIYLQTIPAAAVEQIHLAGYSNMGSFLFDTHANPVYPEVWELYKSAVTKFKNIPTLIEWDEDIPAFEVLENEALKAKKIQKDLGNLS